MTNFVEFRLLDPDLQTVHGILPFQKGDLYLQLNEPGSGSVKTALDIASAALVESGGFIEAHYWADVRGGFFVENLGENDVNAGEEAGRGLEVSGRGALALLEDAVVWTDGGGSNKRVFSGTQAAMLITLIEEAQTRGGLGIVDWDFDATEDSDGETWTDDFPLELTVGTSLLDVVRQIAKTGIDFEMNPDGSGNYVLSAYKLGIGSDKSETVYFRVGVNCTEVSHSEAGGGIRNALLVKYKNGYTATQDAASITARRRRESAVNYDFVQQPDSAATFASAELQGKKDPKKQISVKVYDGAGPRAFVDYVLGDTVTLDVRGAEEEYRIRGIHLSWVDNEHAEVIVDLNSMILENEIRVTQDLDWLLNEWKTAHDAGLLEVKFWAAIGIPNTALGSVDMKVAGDFLYLINGAKLWKYDLVNGGWTTILIHTSNLVAIDSIGSAVYVCDTSRVYLVDGVTLDQVGLFYDSGLTEIKKIVAVGTKLYVIGVYEEVTHNATTVTSDLTYYQSTDDTWYDTGGVNGYNGATDGTNLYVAGVDTGVSGRLRKWDGSSWSNVGGTFPLTISAVHATTTKVIIGVIEAGSDNKLYILNGSTWEVLGGGVNGYVRAIATYFDDVYVGGEFTDRGNYVAKYSGEQWWDMAGGTNGVVNLIQMYGDDVIVDGGFTQAGDKTALNVAMYFNSFEALANYLEHSSDSGFNLGEAIHNATAKTSMTGADEIGFWDSISQQLRKITWTNMLASIRSWLDSILSMQSIYTYTTSGTSTAFTVTTLASATALTTNERFFVSFHTTAGAAPTLNRDGKGAKDLKYYDSTGAKTACGATTILSGMRSEVIYDGTDYILLDLIPVGGGGGTPGGSDTEVQFNDGGAFEGDTEFTWNKTTKELHIGPAARGLRLYGDASDMAMYAPDGENPVVSQHAWDGVPAVLAYTAEGTLASQAAVTLGKVLWQVSAKAFNGTDFKDTGRIRAVVTENHNGTSSGMKWEVYCVNNTTNTEVLVATFDQDGNIDIAAGKEYRVNGAKHTHGASEIHAATSDSSFHDDDEFPKSDSQDSWALKKFTWANVKTALQTLFDTIYLSITGWKPITATWTRTGDHTFTVSGDVTADDNYRPGMKLRYKDGGAYEYGVINSRSYSAPNTTINLVVNSDYAMASATITETYVSPIEKPNGFPEYFNFTGLSVYQNGTVASTLSYARFIIKGLLCHLYFNINITASGSAGNRIEVRGLPVNFKQYNAFLPLELGVGGVYLDSGSAIYNVAGCPVSATTLAFFNDGSGDFLGAAPSFAVANNDTLSISATFELG